MVKKGDNISSLTKVLNEILLISKKFSYLWDEEDIWKEDEDDKYPKKLLPLIFGFIAQDETFDIYITKKGKRFVFDGKNFCNNETGYNAKQASSTIKNYFSGYNISPEKLREAFYGSLEKPLGKYLAKKTLEKTIQKGDKK